MKEFKNDVFSGNVAFSISEAAETDAKDGILCRIKGDFFFPDGFSRNKRFYPKELWEKALSATRIQKKLTERNLYGTISHEQEINDKAFLDGKISHYVSKLEITNEGKGYGEICVLDTPAGKILNTLARAGSKLYVSTRGHGTFKGEKDGQPVVDPQTYILETVDFVLEPGFSEASPELSEAIKNLHNEVEQPDTEIDDHKIGEEIMDKLLERVQTQNEGYVKELKDLRETLEATKGELDAINKENETLVATNGELVAKKEILAKYEALGSVEEMTDLVEKAPAIVKEWKEFKKLDDSASDIREALTMAETVISQYEEIGKPHEITEAFGLLEGFKAKVDEIGTIAEINKALDLLEAHAAKEDERKRNESVAKLAKKLGVAEAKIAKVYGKLSEKEIEEMFEGLSDDLEEFRSPENLINEDDKGADEEEEEGIPAFKKSLAQRLVENYTGTKFE